MQVRLDTPVTVKHLYANKLIEHNATVDMYQEDDGAFRIEVNAQYRDTFRTYSDRQALTIMFNAIRSISGIPA